MRIYDSRPWLGVLALLASLRVFAAELADQVDRYRAAHEAQIVGQLAELVALKSVAADPAGLAETARRLEQLLEARGFNTRLLSVDAAAPLVYGELSTPGAKRTVVYYAHYDGQPVTPSQWASDPFTPTMRSGPPGTSGQPVDWRNARGPFDPEWRLYGRAASDDKASIVAFLAAFDALKASGRKPSVNIKVTWEGEEERGSTHLAEMLKANQTLLHSDLWLIGDGPVHQSRRAQLYFGARGAMALELTIYGPLRALHDGHYGNWAPNPAVMAAGLIAQMRDDEGRILIPGYLDEVRPVTAAEKAALAAVPAVDAALQEEFAIGRSEGTQSLPESLMRPALNIRGVRSGQVGETATNAIPTTAEVSIDFRLVPDQTPEAVRTHVESFLRSKGWTLTEQEPDLAMRRSHPRLIRLQWESGYPALRSDMSTPVARAVIAAAEHGARGPVVLMPTLGGSVPIYLLAEIFNTPVIGVPIVNHDNNQHTANENLRLRNLWDGIQTYAALLAELRW